jgi:uncharacterized repeat protein (TIGR01451 family)
MKRTLVLLAASITAMAGAASLVSAAATIGDNTRAQIQSLQAEKASRNAAQRKMDSQLHYALKQHRNEVIAPGVARLQIDAAVGADGKILVDIKGVVSERLLDFIRNTGGEIVSSVPEFRQVRARVAATQLEPLAARADVSFVRAAARAMTRTGSVNSEGDTTHRALQSRPLFGVNGSGVKVGVLSDSIDFLAVSQTNSDLPPNVSVLPFQEGAGSGEGTAMLEIIHDLAPGAQLFFASAFSGDAQFAKNILDLRAAGCDIIVDDVFYFNESPFQDGIIAQAVNTVTASGALFFSAAGNEGNLKHGTSGTWEGDYVDGGPVGGGPVGVKGGRLHSFVSTNTPFNTINAVGSALVLHWSDPLGSSTNDYDLYIVDGGGNIISSSTTFQTGAQDPYEIALPTAAGQQVVIVKADAAAPRFLHIDTIRGRLGVRTTGNITGHPAATNAFAVAAIDVASSYPFAFTNSANPVENFSTDGPRRVFYHADGTPITNDLLSTGGFVRMKPDITAADGVATTLPANSGLNPFFGTSAAAPHAAAIAALIKSLNPHLTANQIRSILTTNAMDNEFPGYDINGGYGIVMAYHTLLATPAPPLSIVREVVAGGNGNGVFDPNECNSLFVVFTNSGTANYGSSIATLYSSTPGVVIAQPVIALAAVFAGTAHTNTTPFLVSTTPGFVCGTPLQFTLVISNSAALFTNQFTLPGGTVAVSPTLFNNSTPVGIPDNNTNGVDSVINVSGMSGAIGKVTVSLRISHTYDSDLTMELIGPDGTRVNLARNRGFLGADFGSNCTPMSARTTFDDNAPGSIVFATPPFVGAFRPEESLLAFGGKTGAGLNGAWRLHITDRFAQDVGMLECWTLSLYPSICSDGGGICAADLALSASASPNPGIQGSDLTYTIRVTNTHPLTASGAVITNVLPPGVAFVSASSPLGCTVGGGVVTCALGDIAGGATVTATIVVRPLGVGSLSSTFTVGTSTTDVVPANNSATVVISIVEPVPLIETVTAQVIGESFAPPTGGIEAGETVTLNLSLRNVGTGPTANLIAALQAGSGVDSPSAPQSYGAISIGGVATRAFTFTAPGPAGSGIDAVLQLQDGARNLGTVTFHFTVGGEAIFANNSPITINALGAATPYPATINVSGLSGVVSSVRATFSKLTHSFPDDIDALLVGPRGQKVILMSDAGGNNPITNKTITFDAGAAGALPNETAIAAGNYLPSNYDSGTEPSGDAFPTPAPVGASSASLQTFNTTDPNGTWSLFIHDDGGGDSGAVAGGWSLAIGTVYPVNPAANLSVSVSAAPNPAIVGETLTYTLTVANLGPSNTSSIVLSNVIPANSAYVSADTTQGTANFASGVVTFDLGAMANGGTATLHVRVTPTSSGPTSNRATVNGTGIDLDPSNNNVTTTLTANNPVADLAVIVTASPEPTFVSSNLTLIAVVTNRGPNHADSVQLATALSSRLAFVSATNTQGVSVHSAGIVTSTIGSIPANGSVTVTVKTIAANDGFATNAFVLTSPTTDPLAANNSTNVISTINRLEPLIVAAGAAVTAESFVPVNNSIESGETVTLNFGLRNVGSADTTDLVVTLLTTGGVSGPSGPIHYGVVPANGPTAVRGFAFTASGAPGSTLTATFQLQDGALNLGTVAFTFTLSSSRSFTNSNVIIIPTDGPANTYPSTLTVAGVTGAVSKVTVTIKQLTHTFPEDVDMLLVGPGGQKVMLMSDTGGGVGITGVTLTFDDSAALLPFGPTIFSGMYHPTDHTPSDAFPSPAPSGPYGTNLSVLIGSNPNGTWSLYVFDDAGGDQGRINGGWTLDIQTASPVSTPADLGVSVSAPVSAASGAPFTYAITVANYGPAVASGVSLIDTLPPGFVLTGVTSSQGSYSTAPGLVTANLGTLPLGASATLTISGAGVGPASVTNIIAVSASQSDLHPANNTASAVTVLNAPIMNIRRVGADAIITWLWPSTGYSLEASTNASGPFTNSTATVLTANGTNTVVVPAAATKFYRLRRP